MKLKILLAVASFVVATWLFGWMVSLIFLGNIFVHEQGHVWALKRIGHKTKGFYFLPLLGGVTLSEGKFTNRQKRIFVFIMGPVFGMLLALALLVLYWWTNLLTFAFLSGTAAVINLFNLIPIKPLDGGHVFDDLVGEVNQNVSNYCQMGFVVIAIGLAWRWELWSFYFLLTLRLLFHPFKGEEAMPKMPSTHRQIYTGLFVGSIVILFWLCWYNYFELEPVIRRVMEEKK